MPIPSPATTELVVKHDLGGKLAVFYKGERLPGVVNIAATNKAGQRAELTVTFAGMAVRFETEEPVEDNGKAD